jgi:hypothetical protein
MDCVVCDKEILTEKERYSVGESLGEYWCKKCVEAENRDRLEEMLQCDIIQAIKDGFTNGFHVNQENIIKDIEWLIETVQRRRTNDRTLTGSHRNHRKVSAIS